MKSYRLLLGCVVAVSALGFGARIVYSQDKAGTPGTVLVHMVITDEAVRDNTEVPILRPENVQVKQGKNLLKIDHVIPARGAVRTARITASRPRTLTSRASWGWALQ